MNMIQHKKTHKCKDYHHHNISFMELGYSLTCSGLMYPEVSSKVYHDFFCQLGSSISLPWVNYFKAFYLHVLSSQSCIPVICPKFVLFLTAVQYVHLFCNLSKCILLFFSCISSLLLLFFWPHLLWACNPFRGNFNHWQVSRKEAGDIKIIFYFNNSN